MLPLLIPALIAGGASLASGLIQGASASSAAGVQSAAAGAGIAALKEALSPYTQSGAKAVSAQGDLAGLNGADAQQAAIAALSGGPEMQALVQSGENSMLQNAAATGGLRGGNLEGALAQFRPQMLSQIIAQQYSRLGNLSALGQNSAATMGTGVATLLGKQGDAQAAGKIAQGQMWNAIPNAVMAGMGMYTGLGGGFESAPDTRQSYGSMPLASSRF